MYVPNDDNSYGFDFGAGVEEDTKTRDIMVGMRDDHLLIANYIFNENTENNVNEAIEMRLVNAVNGSSISSTTVYNLSNTLDDDEAFEALVWSGQEVDIQHYLLLERDGDHFITYRQDSSDEMIEVNVFTGDYTTVSTTFGLYADLNNLALDASGLYAYFHTENGFVEDRDETMCKCMVLFYQNDGSVNDTGSGYND